MARRPRVPSKWIRSPLDELAVSRGYFFDETPAERFRDFAYQLCQHYQGEWAGRPFELMNWQYNEIVAPIYGWKKADGRRRHTDGHIEVVKKVGKTTLAEVMALHGFVADGEPGAAVGVVAVDRAQGSTLFDGIAAMVRQSPDLASAIDVIDSRKTLVHQASNSKLFVLSSDVASKEGYNLSTLIRDELHAWPHGGMFETLRYAGIARRQPLFLSLTTAGVFDPTSVGWQQHEYARRVLSGEIDDLNFFAFILGAKADEDWTDPAVWQRVTPSLGVTVRLDELTAQAEAAKYSVGLENSFKRYRLNIWTQSTERWLSLETFDASAGHAIDEADYVGQPFFGGIDIGSVADLSVCAYLFPCPHDPTALDLVLRAFLPAAALRSGRNADLYVKWQRAGVLTVTPGDVTDEVQIVHTVAADVERFGCRSIAIDRLFQAMRLSQDLAALGLAIFPCGMGTMSLSPLVSELEKRILSKTFHHGGHPILRSAIDAVEMELDGAGNRKPSRHDRTKKIDAVIATLLALDRQLREPAPPAEPEYQVLFLGGRR